MPIVKYDKSKEVDIDNPQRFRLSGPNLGKLDKDSFWSGFCTALILATDESVEFGGEVGKGEMFAHLWTQVPPREVMMALQFQWGLTVTNADGSPLWEGYEAPWELDNSGK